MPETIKYLEDLFGVKATMATDPTVTVDIDRDARQGRPQPGGRTAVG